MTITEPVKQAVIKALSTLYNHTATTAELTINTTKPEFEGDYTVVLFGFVKQLKKSPEQLGNELGEFLVKDNPELFSAFNVIKGFLNLTIADQYWIDFLNRAYSHPDFGKQPSNGKRVMVEYSSPNTNKPLHLGHLRNIFLGWSVAEIMKGSGFDIVKSCIVNDRGVHICKSMIAWQLFANGETPQSTGMKGDHFVGDYYVKFSNELKKQVKPILESAINKEQPAEFSDQELIKLRAIKKTISGFKVKAEELIAELDWVAVKSIGEPAISLCEQAKDGFIKWKEVVREIEKNDQLAVEVKEQKIKQLQKLFKPLLTLEEKISEQDEEIMDLCEHKTALMKATQQMLLDWEAGKPEVMELWARMNGWVYEGFDKTYQRIGADFDKTYYESNTYLLGKKTVEEGLQKGVFVKEADSSVWIDLTSDGLDRKIVQRKDGTSVYITQDIGLAQVKFEEYKMDQSIYVIADEQNYHMKVLKLIAEKLGLPNAGGIYHLSYGMVELPSGRMKSREGTVVDADDIVEEMVAVAKKKTEELGKVKDFNPEELKELYDTLALGALKFFLLRVDPKKKMIFNPEESIEFHGFTGPFVQYTHARIRSILRKEKATANRLPVTGHLLKLEKNLIVTLEQFPVIIEQACTEHNPSVLAIYAFNLAQAYNSFYTEHSVMNAESEEKKQLRLQLCELTANVIRSAMGLLGIRVPERM